MDKRFRNNAIAFLFVLLIWALIPAVFAHAVAYEKTISAQKIVGYTIDMPAVAYSKTGAPLYKYVSTPVFEPNLPTVARATSEAEKLVHYPSKVPVADLVQVNTDSAGRKVFALAEEGVFSSGGPSVARAVAKTMLGVGTGVILDELVNPTATSDAMIPADKWEIVGLCLENEPNLTLAEIQSIIAADNGIDPTPAPSGAVYTPDHKPWADGYEMTGYVHTGGYWTCGGKNGPAHPLLFCDPYYQIFEDHWFPGSDRCAIINMSRAPVGTTYYYDGYYFGSGRQPSSYVPSGGFDPSKYPDLYTGTKGVINAIASAIAHGLQAELAPAPAPSYVPDTDTGFMRFGGKTQVAGKDGWIGPDQSYRPLPDGVTLKDGIPYVDPTSIGVSLDPKDLSADPQKISPETFGLPPGSRIKSWDPVTGQITYVDPQGVEKTKLADRVAGDKLTELYKNTTTQTNSTVTNNHVSPSEDYTFKDPGLPGPPTFPTDFEVPEPDPWPWLQWMDNPFKTDVLDKIQITASGDSKLNFPVNFPWHPVVVQVDFAEYQSQLQLVGSYMITIAYIMAALMVIRKN